MKFSFILPTLATLFLSFVVLPESKQLDDYALNDKEEASFGEVIDHTYQIASSFRRSANDGSKFIIQKNKGDTLFLANSKACNRQNQSELILYYNYGIVKRIGDTLLFNIRSNYKRNFLFSLGSESFIDLGPEVIIKMIAQNQNGEMVIPRINSNGSHTDVYCLPVMTDRRALSKATHKDKHMASFSYLYVSDNEGHELILNADDYVLVSGDVLIMNEQPYK